MSTKTVIKYKRYSESLKQQIVEEYNRGGMSYVQLQQKHEIGCVSTIKNWVESSSSNATIFKKQGNKQMIDKSKYDDLKLENKRLKLKVAEAYMLEDIAKWQRESIEELLGKKALLAVDKHTKKKLQ